MSITATKIPPRTSLILPKVKDLIVSADINTALGGPGRVIVAKAGTINVPAPTPDASGYWGRIVLMPITKGFYQVPEHPDLVTGYPFQIRVDVNPTGSDSFDPDITLEYIHGLIYKAVQYKTITGLTNSKQIYPIQRTRRPLDSIRDDSGFYYSSSKFITVVSPQSS